MVHRLSCPVACGMLVPRPGIEPASPALEGGFFFSFFFFFNREHFFSFFKFYLFILFMAVLGLRFCARALCSCGKRGPLFIAVRGPLTIAASLVAEHRLQTCRLSNCGSWAQPLRGMRDPPRPGLEPVSPALAGRLSTTAPPGKPGRRILNHWTTREVPVDLCKELIWGFINLLLFCFLLH